MIKTLLLLFIVFFISSCNKHIDTPCPSDLLFFMNSMAAKSDTIKHGEIDFEIGYIKSILAIEAKGKLVYSTPDSFYIEVFTEWGESLVNIYGVNGKMSVKSTLLGDVRNSPIVDNSEAYVSIIRMILGRPHIPFQLMGAFTELFCNEKEITLTGDRFTALFEKSSGNLVSFSAKDDQFLVQFSAYDTFLRPQKVKIKTRQSGTISVAVTKRVLK